MSDVLGSQSPQPVYLINSDTLTPATNANPSPSMIADGAGSGRKASVNASNELNVAASVTSSALPIGAATSNNQTLEITQLTAINNNTDGLETLVTSTNTKLDTVNTNLTTINGNVDGLETLNGAVTEIAPATDTASSGLNGRLQRIAQRITSLIALLPTSLGQKTMANSLAVVLASDQSAVPVNTKTALTASSPTFATVGITSAQAVASNANRKGLVLINTSVNVISFGLGATAVLNSGITLKPGGVWTMDEYTFTTGAINAIASLASSNLAIQELTT